MNLSYCAVVRLSLALVLWLGVAGDQVAGAAGREGAPAEPSAPDRQRQRLSRWLQSPNESRRLEAVDELLADARAENLSLLLPALRDPSPEIRATVAGSLNRFTDPRVVPALRGLLADENDHVRATAVWVLSACGGPPVLPEVVRLAQHDPARIVRFRAVWGLAAIGDRSALPVAINALTDENVSVRERAALLAIEKLADATVPARLLKLRSHPQPATRRLVMYLLGRYGDDAVVPPLCAGLKDPDPLVRGEAALALGRRHARAAGAPLVPLLRDPDEHVRGSAAYALGLIGAPAAASALRPLLQDESAFVRAVAAESLHRLGDQTVKPPDGFDAAELFTFPIYSPEHQELYR